MNKQNKSEQQELFVVLYQVCSFGLRLCRWIVKKIKNLNFY